MLHSITLFKKILLIMALFAYPAYGLNIIFDLHSVCIVTDTRKSLFYLPALPLVYYLSLFRQSPKVSLYRILELIQPSSANNLSNAPADEYGTPVPSLMADWLKGKTNSDQTKKLITQECNNHPEWFKHYSEKTIVLALTNMIFTPISFIDIHKLADDAYTLVLNCKNAGHKVYVLSNWDESSSGLLKAKYPDFFALFDGIGISGQMKLAKPDPAIYQQLLKEYNLTAEESWFIDDQLININAAKNLGINTILCQPKRGWLTTSPNLAAVWQTLKKVVPAYTNAAAENANASGVSQ